MVGQHILVAGRIHLVRSEGQAERAVSGEGAPNHYSSATKFSSLEEPLFFLQIFPVELISVGTIQE